MTKLSIGIIGILTVSVVLLACGGQTSSPGVVVKVEPDSIQSDAGEEIVVTVRVEQTNGGRGISGGELNLAFEPEVLQVLGIAPGDLFGPSPLVGAEIVDNESGTLTYALARRGATSAPTPAAAFAQITFKVADTASDGSYDLTVTKVGLADEAFQDIPDITLRSGTVNL